MMDLTFAEPSEQNGAANGLTAHPSEDADDLSNRSAAASKVDSLVLWESEMVVLVVGIQSRREAK